MSDVDYARDLDRRRIRIDDWNRTVTIERGLWERIGCYNGTLPTSPSPGRIYRREGIESCTNLDRPEQARIYRSGESGPGNHHDTLYFVREEPGEPGWQRHYPYRAVVVDGPVDRFPAPERIR